jgi:hypothetical protein
MLKNLNLKVKPVLKIAGLAVLAVFAIYIVFVFLSLIFGSISGKIQPGAGGYSKNVSYDSAGSMVAPMMAESQAGGMFGLSTRNAEYGMDDSSYRDTNVATGNQAEKYEVTEYNASIETRQLEKTCAAVSGLKAREDVIFSNAREYRNGCNYSFKVTKDKAGEILALLKGMDPKELSGTTYTIQGQVEDYTSQIDVLRNKLLSIDETLSKAVAAYDEVSVAATNAKDVESLAKVIDHKMDIIERLTQERISINSQFDQIQRAKAQQLDRLDYTYFSVNISRDVLVDRQNLKDSWDYAIKNSVSQINQTIQNISINLVGFLFGLFQYAVYGLILLIAAKYGWKLVRSIWKN